MGRESEIESYTRTSCVVCNTFTSLAHKNPNATHPFRFAILLALGPAQPLPPQSHRTRASIRAAMYGCACADCAGVTTTLSCAAAAAAAGFAQRPESQSRKLKSLPIQFKSLPLQRVLMKTFGVWRVARFPLFQLCAAFAIAFARARFLMCEVK